MTEKKLAQSKSKYITSEEMIAITENSQSDNETDPASRHSSNLEQFLQRTKQAFTKENRLDELKDATDSNSDISGESFSLAGESSIGSESEGSEGDEEEEDQKGVA